MIGLEGSSGRGWDSVTAPGGFCFSALIRPPGPAIAYGLASRDVNADETFYELDRVPEFSTKLMFGFFVVSCLIKSD